MQVMVSKSKYSKGNVPLLTPKANEMDVNKFYVYCKLKLKTYIFNNYTINTEVARIINNYIDSIPNFMFDGLDTDTSKLLLLNSMVYSLYGIVELDQSSLYNEVISYLYQYDQRL